MRIAVAGLLHYTNSFAAGTADLGAFEAPGGWPALARGTALPQALRDTAAPIAGALDALREQGGVPVGLLWALALPSGPVDHAALETLAGEIIERLANAHRTTRVDGVYLDLHRALVTTACDDGEGMLLERVRQVVGSAVPVVASLDAHANISALMVDLTEHLEIFRTYPHTDMRDTGARAMARLLAIIARGHGFPKAFRPVPFLTSIVAQSTLDEPTKGLVARGVTRAQEVTSGALGQAFGFPLADVADAGPSIVAYADTAAEANALADAQLADWLAAEHAFGVELYLPGEAVREAQRITKGGGRQVVIADAQDNPGGGTSNTTGLLHALIDAHAQDALLIHISDAAAVRRAVEAGVGGRCDGPLGGSADPHTGEPVAGPFHVDALGDGSFVGEGPMYRGNAIALGPVALLRKGGVHIIVAGRAMQASEPGLPRHLGLDPHGAAILVLKSAVHFRAAYGNAAAATLIAKAPGCCAVDLTALTFRRAGRRIAGTAPAPVGAA